MAITKEELAKREKLYAKAEKRKKRKKRWSKLYAWLMIFALTATVIISFILAILSYFSII